MTWQNRIICDPDILVGKPTIKGTRISVDLILKCFASGWSREQFFESYPHVSAADLTAAFEFAAHVVSIKNNWELVNPTSE